MFSYVSKNIILNNLKLHTEAFGDPANSACILLAGQMSTARFWTDTFCQYFAKQGFFTIRYDYRDVGGSSAINWENSCYSMLDLTQDIILLMNNYGLEKAHFVGFSMGGEICQLLGTNYPNRVSSLAIIAAEPIEITNSITTPLTAQEQENITTTINMLNSIKQGNTLAATIQNYLPLWRHLNAEIPVDETITTNFTIDLFTRTKNHNAQNHLLMREEFLAHRKNLHFLPKITAPTLIIHGNKDPLILPKHGKSIANAIPNSKLIIIPGMGHAFFNKTLENKIAKLIIRHCKNNHYLNAK